MRNAYDWHQAGELPDRDDDAPEKTVSELLDSTGWEVKEIDGETWVVDEYGHPSARVYASGFAIPEWYEKVQEQARLYAAAPDLLHALLSLINPAGHTDACTERHEFGMPGCSRACAKARAAIRKATGEEMPGWDGGA